MEVVVILMVFVIVGVIIVMVSSMIGSVARRRLLHQERMAAISKGVPLPDDLLSDTTPAEWRAGSGGSSAALHGTIWTSVGVGILLSSKLVRSPRFGNDMQQFLEFLAVWAWPALSVGVGLLIYAWFSRPKKGA